LAVLRPSSLTGWSERFGFLPPPRKPSDRRTRRLAGFDVLSGEGARLYGGRWNAPRRPLIYTAETAALAVLEVRVHLDLDWDLLPDDYVLVAIDTAAIVTETIHEFPDDPRAFGDACIESRRSALLRVPSWIVPESHNVLINPAHPDAPSIHLGPVRPFRFDRRLWTPR
jgi:RES domain-containing protein